MRTIALFVAFLCALVLMTLFVGDFTMARDGNYKFRLSTVEGDPPAKGSMEEYMTTPKGQALERIFDMMDTGDREGAEKLMEEFKAKWPVEPAAPAPGKPSADKYIPRPMVLPPEAR